MDGSPQPPRTPRTPRTPPPASRKRNRSESEESPRTPSPTEPTYVEPSSPPVRRHRSNRNPPDFVAVRNLSSDFEEAARLQQEANDFHAEQDGEEQQVPELNIETPVCLISYSDLCFEWSEVEGSDETEEDGEEQHVPE